MRPNAESAHGVEVGPPGEVGNPLRLRLVYAALAYLLAACWLYAISFQFLHDPDTFWHVRTGQEIWQGRQFPVADTYSYTFAGKPWIAKEWLSQIVLFLVWEYGGWNGLVALVVFVLSLSAALQCFFLTARLNCVFALVLTVGALFLSMQTYLARPHILTFPLVILWTEHLVRRAEEARAPSFPMLALVALWANLHAGFTVGFIIAALSLLIFAEKTRASDRAGLAKWLLFLGGCVLASLLHPYGLRPMLATVNVFGGNKWLELPGEWRPVDMIEEPLHQVVILAAVLAVLYFGIGLRVAKAVFVIVMVYFFQSHVRFAYLAYFLVPLACSYEIAVRKRALSSRPAALRPDAIANSMAAHAGKIVMSFLAIYVAVGAAVFVKADARPSPAIAPAAAVTFARSSGLTGNVLNSGEFGGYLIFSGIKTFVDGRSDQLFGNSFLQSLLDASRVGGGCKLEDLLRRYDVQWLLLMPSDKKVPLLDENSGWTRIYTDSSAVIFVGAGQGRGTCSRRPASGPQ